VSEAFFLVEKIDGSFWYERESSLLLGKSKAKEIPNIFFIVLQFCFFGVTTSCRTK